MLLWILETVMFIYKQLRVLTVSTFWSMHIFGFFAQSKLFLGSVLKLSIFMHVIVVISLNVVNISNKRVVLCVLLAILSYTF